MTHPNPITAREADEIAEALLAAPHDIAAIAQRFGRKPQTIVRLRYARRVK